MRVCEADGDWWVRGIFGFVGGNRIGTLGLGLGLREAATLRLAVRQFHRSVSYARNTTMKFADLIAGRRKKHKLLSWVSGTMQLGLL
jgi:hypothetical protein